MCLFGQRKFLHKKFVPSHGFNIFGAASSDDAKKMDLD